MLEPPGGGASDGRPPPAWACHTATHPLEQSPRVHTSQRGGAAQPRPVKRARAASYFARQSCSPGTASSLSLIDATSSLPQRLTPSLPGYCTRQVEALCSPDVHRIREGLGKNWCYPRVNIHHVSAKSCRVGMAHHGLNFSSVLHLNAKRGRLVKAPYSSPAVFDY